MKQVLQHVRSGKLELAEEFRQIGDKEGARELLQEVVRGGDASQFRHGGEQCGGLGRGRGNHDLAERAVGESFGVLQVPVFLATKDFGDAAGELHL